MTGAPKRNASRARPLRNLWSPTQHQQERGSAGMMTSMSTPQSGDISAGQYRLAQVSRLIRSAQSLAEKIAELTEDELARLCDERGNVVPGAIAADSANARAADRLTVGGVAFCYVVDEAPEADRTVSFGEN
jgi:hypothetical protein